MTEILGLETGLNFGVDKISGFTIYLVWIFGFLVLAILAGILIWVFNQKQLFKNKIVIFENVNGQGFIVSKRDKARSIRLAKDGTEVFYLKKAKLLLSAYGQKMGHNQYWFVIGPDGGWYNFVLGDFDAKTGILDIDLIDRDLRPAMVNMLKQATEEYGAKQSFMDKWGNQIFALIYWIVIIAGMSYLISQMGGVVSQLSAALNAQGETIKTRKLGGDAVEFKS
jgi:hypothetical protein